MFDEIMPAAQDMEMWLRIAKVYKVGFVDEPLVDYYIHAGESITGNYSKKLFATERILEKYSGYLKEHKREHGIRLLKLAPYYVVTKNHKKAVATYFKGVVKVPGMIRLNIEYLAKCVRAAISGVM